jgi:hypothetical protein
MSAKHTSGLLLAIDFGNSFEWDVVKPDVKACNGYWHIANCSGEPDDGTAKANAQLFAAAPDLLEALGQTLNAMIHLELSDSSKNEWEAAKAVAYAAIAKATGGAA